MNNINKRQALHLLNELVEIPSYTGESNPRSEKLLAEYLKIILKPWLLSPIF